MKTDKERGRLSVYVSYEAWQGLKQQARRYSHEYKGKKPNAEPHLTDMIKEWPPDPELYVDKRPDHMVETDLMMLESGLFPQWGYDYPKLRHYITLTTGQRNKLVAISVHWGITNNYRPGLWDLPTSRIGALLEAVGLGLLGVPTQAS